MHDNNEKPREAIGYMTIFPNTNTHIYQLMHTYISSYAYIPMKQKAKYVKAWTSESVVLGIFYDCMWKSLKS